MLAALKSNPEASLSDLIIYVDGPKGSADRHAVLDVRDLVRSVHGFGSVVWHLSEENLGLSRSIIRGVSEVLALRDRAIVIEDDIVVSQYFLSYMNQALSIYESDESVASVHGYLYPLDRPVPDTFFLKGADCWGWGTWTRAWRHFNPDGSQLLSELQARNEIREFDLGGVAPYSRLLKGQIRGENDSWAVRWHASTFLDGMLTLYPGKSLVRNIGIDGSGTHSGVGGVFESDVAADPIEVSPIAREESLIARQAFSEYFASGQRGLRPRLRHGFRSLFPK